MNEDQLIDAAEREMDLYRGEIARITAGRDGYRDALTRAREILGETATPHSSRTRRARAVITAALRETAQESP